MAVTCGLSPSVTEPRNARFRLEKCTPEDIPTYTAIQFAAFNNPFTYEPYHEVLYPGGDTAIAREKASKRILEDLLTEEKSTFLKVVDIETGDVAGCCRWAVHHENPGLNRQRIPVDWVESGPGGFMEGREDEQAYTEHIVNGLYLNRDKVTGTQPYVVLDMLFVSDKYQRQGVGQLLMDWGVSKADELGYQSIIESTITGKRLYEKNGYTGKRVHIEVPEKWLWRTPIQFWIMYRPAKA